MTPDEIGKLLGSLGDALGLAAKAAVVDPFEALMKSVWMVSLAILRGAFELVDKFSEFSVSTEEGPIGVLWPLMLWISGVLALGLFFAQITATMLRGGRGFMRLVTGPFQYGIAIAATAGMVGVLLSAADGMTEAILTYGLNVDRFDKALQLTGLTDALTESVQAVALGLGGLFGVIPAALGYVVEMLFREAAIYVLVATIPLTAAGLVYSSTTVWFWRGLRWTIVVVVMKPALGLTMVIGVAIGGSAQGLSGLLAGIGVLLVALCVPLVLFKLFAFIDPTTDPGAAFRDQASSFGLDSYGKDSPAGKLGKNAFGQMGKGKSDDEGDGDGQQEQSNADRFDAALDDGDESLDAVGAGHDSDDEDAAGDPPSDDGAGAESDDGTADDDSDPVADPGDDTSPADLPGSPAAAADGGDDDAPGPPDPPGGGASPPTPPTPDGGPDSGGGGGGGDGASDAEIEEAAVAL